MSMRIGSLRDFREWAKGKDPSETYDYMDWQSCAIAQYARDRGVEYNPTFGERNSFDHLEGTAQQRITLGIGAYRHPLNFGGLVKEIEYRIENEIVI